MYIRRAIEDTVRKISETFPVLLVTGPRQVGKTTLLSRLAEEGRQYVTLDDPGARLMARRDPALFMQRYTPPVIVDEIQYAPEILPYIKMSVDKSRRKGGFWLTGSQQFHMMKNVGESLAGRVGIANLSGLSQSELAGVTSEKFTVDPDRLLSRFKNTQQIGLNDAFKRIFKGSMPAIYSDNNIELDIFYGSYLNTYLQRDIKDLTQVANETSFIDFMTVVAARTAKPVHYEQIASEVGISSPTAKKWISVLVSSGIVALVQPYRNNILKRAIKSPIMHFLDTGLCSYLLKWADAETLERGSASGAFFESHVFSEIYKSYANEGRIPPIYYYRDRDQKEIDLLLYQNGTLYPIEIKKTASPGKEATKHFKVLGPVAEPERFGPSDQPKVKIGTGAVVCMATDLRPIDENNWQVPFWLV
ncbi:MAG: ATP-binding protein [Deltaproteobacteria bacterium]|jgi:predicted AAA+ superfamily ATPase|nr:ATP-binding protein [Deltaproteobacteria bacterium]